MFLLVLRNGLFLQWSSIFLIGYDMVSFGLIH